MREPELSVIVCTYNRPEALRAVLAGLRDQRHDAFEVIVADDGSGPPTRQVVEVMAPAFGGRLHHVWQEDLGFRLSAARNRAAERARSSFLVFLDGDCIPRPGFVGTYVGCRHPGRIVRGSRVLCSETLTQRVEGGTEPALHSRSGAELRELHRRGEINRIGPLLGGVLDPLMVLASALRPRNWKLLRGCNFMVPRDAYFAVGGSDESYVGWGYEDSDLCIRLMNHGLRIRRSPAATCVLHLWHRENDRRFEGENLARLTETLGSGRTMAHIGLGAQPAGS